MFGLGTTELLIIGGLIFLIFGAKRIPEIGKGLGGGLREFRKIKRELSQVQDEDKDGKDEKTDRDKNPQDFQNQIKKNVMEQVPGVKKAMGIDEKIKKVKEIIK